MSRKQIIANILSMSSMVGAIITILSGWLIAYQTDNSDTFISSLLYTGMIILLFTLLFVFIRKYSYPTLRSWYMVPNIVLALYGIYVTAIQHREMEYLFILPGAILVATAVIFVAARFLAKTGSESPAPDSAGLGMLIQSLITFILITLILPAAAAAYMRFALPPKIKFSQDTIEVGYDRPQEQSYFGIKDKGAGLYVRYGADMKGDHDYDHELAVQAYLVSSDTGEFDDEQEYMRRARFLYYLHDGTRVLEGPEGWNDLFLPYSIITGGEVQGGFDNYRPEPLHSILAKNDATQFAIEIIALLQEELDYPGQERDILSQVRRVVPLTYEHTASEKREQYLNSQWAAIISGKEWHPPARSGEYQDDRSGRMKQAESRSVETGDGGQAESEQPGPEVPPIKQENPDEDEWGDL